MQQSSFCKIFEHFIANKIKFNQAEYSEVIRKAQVHQIKVSDSVYETGDILSTRK